MGEESQALQPTHLAAALQSALPLRNRQGLTRHVTVGKEKAEGFAFAGPPDESFTDRDDPAICNGTLFSDGVGFGVPARRLKQGDDKLSTGVGFSGHGLPGLVRPQRSSNLLYRDGRLTGVLLEQKGKLHKRLDRAGRPF
jgi:hypothetical protein